MAVHREQEICPKCGGEIKSLHNNMGKDFVGDTFLKWDYDSHVCQRFKMPESKDIVGMALLFNNGKIEREKLTDMVAMCQMIIDRLYENGDINIPSSKEDKS